MSENHASYSVAGNDTVSLDEIRSWSSIRLFHDPAYTAPEPAQVKALLQYAGFTQVEAAKLIGVNFDEKKGGSNVIRRYIAERSNKNHRQIPYASWRLLLLYAGIVSIESGIHPVATKRILHAH